MRSRTKGLLCSIIKIAMGINIDSSSSALPWNGSLSAKKWSPYSTLPSLFLTILGMVSSQARLS